MADIKDTVAAHITANWNAAVLGGSGAVPVADAVGPEDILKPEDYPEAILVYNETVGYDRVYNQGTLGDRHTRVYMLLTAHTRTGCTKTHFRAFIDELKSVFGSAITGFDLQVLDPETNVTRTAGHSGGMYQASFVLHLWEYGVSTSSAASGGAAGASYWAEPFIVWQASANLTNEKTLEAALQDIDSYGDTFASDNAISLKPSGDSDDYLEFSTVSGVPRITIIGGWATRLYSDYGTQTDFQIYSSSAGTNAMTLRAQNAYGWINNATGYLMIRAASDIRLQASGDSDDYISFLTASGIPQIYRVGGGDIYMTSDDATNVTTQWREDASWFGQWSWRKDSNVFRCYAKGAVQFMVSGDTDDYWYFSTAANIASLLPVEDKVHNIGSAVLSADHVYSDDFDNTSPYEKVDKPLDKLKAIKDKKDKDDKAVLDYASMPDFVRSHYRDTSKDKIEEYEDEHGNTQQRVTERAPKDQIADEGWSVNRMVLFLIQAVQELTAKVEALEAQ